MSKPVPMTTKSKELDEILTKLNAYHIDGEVLGETFTAEEHYALYPELKQAKADIEALITAEKTALLGELVEIGKNHGFERLNLVVEYQDGTNSGVIPYRKAWNDAYDRFIIALTEAREKLKQD